MQPGTPTLPLIFLEAQVSVILSIFPMHAVHIYRTYHPSFNITQCGANCRNYDSLCVIFSCLFGISLLSEYFPLFSVTYRCMRFEVIMAVTVNNIGSDSMLFGRSVPTFWSNHPQRWTFWVMYEVIVACLRGTV